MAVVAAWVEGAGCCGAWAGGVEGWWRGEFSCGGEGGGWREGVDAVEGETGEDGEEGVVAG